MEDLFKNLLSNINVTDFGDPSLIQPPVLAYLGDSVHNLFVRCYLVSSHSSKVNNLHKLSVSYVSAHSQSNFLHNIYDELSEHEQYVIKRGRNSKTGSVPKNAELSEYKYATGFETLIGYLFCSNQLDRLMEILIMSVSQNPIVKEPTHHLNSREVDTNE